MSGTGGYRDGAALWAAMTSRAKETAKATRADHGELVRRFVYDRFLARVFHDLNAPWVLKGGTAVLARVNDARTTKDVDLLVELDNLDIALERLRASVAVDLGDHFRFVITGYDASVGGAGQPQVGGYRVHVDAYCGAIKKQTFGVDLVTGSLMTTAPEINTPPAVLELRGLTSPTLRLYPSSTTSPTSCARPRQRTAPPETSHRAAFVTSWTWSSSPEHRTWMATASSWPSVRSGRTGPCLVNLCSLPRKVGVGGTHLSPRPCAHATA